MKKKDLKQVKDKSLDELTKELREKEEALSKFRLELMSGKVKNLRMGKNLRKDIAQVKTIINGKKSL